MAGDEGREGKWFRANRFVASRARVLNSRERHALIRRMTHSLLLFLLLTACGAAGTSPVAGSDDATPLPATVAPSDCGLTVTFASYAMGVDVGTLRAVERLLEQDDAVAAIQRHGWGREGEITLCARIARDADAERLHQRIAGLLPANPRGPIRAATRSGLTVAAPRR